MEHICRCVCAIGQRFEQITKATVRNSVSVSSCDDILSSKKKVSYKNWLFFCELKKQNVSFIFLLGFLTAYIPASDKESD